MKKEGLTEWIGQLLSAKRILKKNCFQKIYDSKYFSIVCAVQIENQVIYRFLERAQDLKNK